MSTVKVTITLGADELEQIRALVQENRTGSVSMFVQQAVRHSLTDVAGWATALAEAIEGTGGPLTQAEVDWADDVLNGGDGLGPINPRVA